jgi:hypothetical protein
MKFCPYCLEEFSSRTRETCGKNLCRSRTTSWNTWVRNERTRAVSGDVNRPQPKARPLPAFSAKSRELHEMVYPALSMAEEVQLFLDRYHPGEEVAA